MLKNYAQMAGVVLCLLAHSARAGFELHLDETSLQNNGSTYTVNVLLKLNSLGPNDDVAQPPGIISLFSTLSFSPDTDKLLFNRILAPSNPLFPSNAVYDSELYNDEIHPNDKIQVTVRRGSPASYPIARDGAQLFQLEFTELPGAPSQYTISLEQEASSYIILGGEFPSTFTSVNSMLVISAVPEPHSLGLFSAAIASIALWRRKRA